MDFGFLGQEGKDEHRRRTTQQSEQESNNGKMTTIGRCHAVSLDPPPPSNLSHLIHSISHKWIQQLNDPSILFSPALPYSGLVNW